MPSGISKAKGRRSSRKKGYYTQQFMRTTRNKYRRSAKRTQRRAAWQAKGVKRNGAPVRGAVAKAVVE